MNIKIAAITSLILFLLFCLPWEGGMDGEPLSKEKSPNSAEIVLAMPLEHSLVSEDPASSPLFLLLLGSGMAAYTLYKKKHSSKENAQ
ncbi:MAG: hypothetical protein KJ645_09080 [Planctomycetes bacterium]|nr:hypothetical protein [Planctomycetota bacterium]